MPIDPKTSNPREKSGLEDVNTTLELNQAVQMALADSPSLRAESHELHALKADTDQAGRWSNPEVEFEIEEIDAGVDIHGLDSAEVSLRLGQRFELGGKRKKRVASAALDVQIQQNQLEQKRIDVVCNTKQAFFGALAAQEQFQLAQSKVFVAEEVLRVIRARVEAGESSPLDEIKAQIEVDRQSIELQEAEQSLNAALIELATHCGMDTPLSAVRGALDPGDVTLPTEENLFTVLQSSPGVVRAKAVTQKKNALLRLERAQRIPDITIQGGIHRFEETEQTGFSVGLGFPLKLFDRNQGHIERAASELAIAQQRVLDHNRMAHTRSAQLLGQLEAARNAIEVLRGEIVPRAREVFQASKTGYREGKFGYLDVLMAQHALVDAQTDLITSHLSFRTAEIELERLLGVSLGSAHQSR